MLSGRQAKWNANKISPPTRSTTSRPTHPSPLSPKYLPYPHTPKSPFSTVPETLKIDAALPSRSRAVIVGGGVIGTSVAYHLAKLGWRDVTLLERSQLTSGTTWHAAGLVGQLRGNQTETELACYGTELYARLEQETGQGTGWRQCGSVSVARTEERMTFLKRHAARGKAFGIEAHFVSLADAKKMWPLLNTEGLKGALWLPKDGVVTSSDLTMAYAKGAKMNGAKIVENVRVTGINTEKGAVKSVDTTDGRIECEVLINCAGLWARKIGKMCGVNVPLSPCEHYYIVTKPMDNVTRDTPVLRDPDGYTYYREWSGGLILGGFEPHAKAAFLDGAPDDFSFRLFNEDWDQFQLLMDSGLERVPSLQNAEIRQMVNGPESFTPDNQYIIGEAPELKNFFVAAGFNSSGVASSGGAGRALAEWIVQGSPTMDLWNADIRRFGPYSNNDEYLRQRSKESLGVHYMIAWPHRELQTGRPMRCTPLYDRLLNKGAAFGSKFGWERANWFANKGQDRELKYTWDRPNWFGNVAQEHLACRNGVAVFDQTSFAKLLVSGKDAEKFMQRICANDVGVPPGRIVYTAMLNQNGGCESDCTVTRLSEDSYMVVTSSAKAVRDLDWLRKNIGENENVTANDISASLVVIAVMGPKSRELLSQVSDVPMDNESFPFGTSKEICIGYSRLRASRITYVGELGWELYVPSELAGSVYDEICKVGANLGLRDAGYYAIESLRVEKAYRAWGHDIGPTETPLEAGLGFAVAFNKAVPFIGKEALLKQKSDGLKKRLAVFVFEDPAAYPLGGEPIYRNGEVMSYLTSAQYGHSVGTAVGMGYVKNAKGTVTPDFVKAGQYEVDIAGKRYKVKAQLESAYDPKSLRVKS